MEQSNPTENLVADINSLIEKYYQTTGVRVHNVEVKWTVLSEVSGKLRADAIITKIHLAMS